MNTKLRFLLRFIIIIIFVYLSEIFMRIFNDQRFAKYIIMPFLIMFLFGILIACDHILQEQKNKEKWRINASMLLLLVLPLFLLILTVWGIDLLLFSSIISHIEIKLPSLLSILRDSHFGLPILSASLGFFLATSFHKHDLM